MGTKEGLNTDESKLFEQLHDAIFSYDGDSAKKITHNIIKKKINPIQVMDGPISGIARDVGEKFDDGKIFLPHLVMAGEILSEVSDILTASMAEDDSKRMSEKVVVIGTVESDIHSIGKSIVAMLLKANGFKVHDLGVDVKSELFIQQAEIHHADIIAMSSLLTTTMPYQQEVMEDLDRLSLRNNFKVMIGGGPITQEWADEIKADGFGKDASEAVKVAKQLVSQE